MPDNKKVSSEMGALIGKKESNRAEVIRLLWAYVKKNNLQCKDDSKYFVPDEKMYKIFGSEKIKKSNIPLYIDAHLSQIAQDDAKDDIAKDDIAKDDIAKDDTAKDDTAKDDTAKDDIAKDDIAKDDIAKDDIAKDDIAKDDVAKDDNAKDDIAKDDGEGLENIQCHIIGVDSDDIYCAHMTHVNGSHVWENIRPQEPRSYTLYFENSDAANAHC